MSTQKSSRKKVNTALKESEIQKNPDKRIDQDFPGFPHHPSAKKNIKPETKNEKLTAGVKKKSKSTKK